ncbi:MAG TPA: GDSL-type esterase/lipase family protein [Chitinophagaceae bacterium]
MVGSSFLKSFFLAILPMSTGFVWALPAPVKVACIGNSVTFGAGLKHRETTSYPAVLQQLLGGKYTVRNFGHSGATLLRKGHNPYFKTTAFREALTFVPDIAIIHLGLNDTDPRNWPAYRDEFAANYAWLIDTFRKGNPEVIIYISKMTPIFHDHPRFRSGTRDWFWQIQELIPQIAAANKTGLIDFHTPLHSRPDLFPDALHPNEVGASIMAKSVYGAISGDYGGLQLPAVFSSHMVLQRDRPIPFYGTADSGAKVHISFNGLNKTVVTGANGRWKLEFPAHKAGGPYKVTIASRGRTIVLEDVLIGEVWLCSGQSNMDFPLQAAINSQAEMVRAEQSPAIRLLNREPIAETDNRAWDSVTLEKVNRLQYFSGTWQHCDSSAAKSFSAVAYYFAQRLHQQLQVPVGVIQVAVGGSTTESWVDRYTMEHHPVLVNELYGWRQSDFIMPWVRERTDTNLKNSTAPKQRHPFEPAYNFEAGIASLTRFPIRGVLWYQGESNAHNVELHETVFPALVKSWRKHWGYEFPFYYVQLSSLNRPAWPHFRQSQLQLLETIPNSGMAVSSDVGDPADVHPRRKKEVGERLARLALHFTYGHKNIVPYGPMPLKAIKVNNHLVLSFRYTGSQLMTNDGAALRGFTLVNDKGEASEVKAIIQKDQVVITLTGKERIREVRYGWAPFTNANLINEAGLPASIFKLTIR